SEGKKSDIQGHWAETQLVEWIDKDWIVGYGNGIYKPNQAITRAEFITLINRSFGLRNKSDDNIPELNVQDWMYEQVAIALHAGYISGYGDNTLRVGNKVTRQEAAIMMAKLLKLDSADHNELNQFSDAASLPEWGKGLLGAIVAKGILSGYSNGMLGYDKTLTRAEAIVMIHR